MSKLIRVRVRTGKFVPGGVYRVEDPYADLLLSGGLATEVESLATRRATERPTRQEDPEIPESTAKRAPAPDRGLDVILGEAKKKAR